MASSHNLLKVKAIPTDKLVASGWGTPKAGNRTQGQTAAPSTARSNASNLDKTPKKGLEDSINLEVAPHSPCINLHKILAHPVQRCLGSIDCPFTELQVMLKLRETFMKADADGGGDLDIEEFVAAFDGT